MSRRHLHFELNGSDRSAIEQACAAQLERLEDVALEHVRIQERRAVIAGDMLISVSFESDAAAKAGSSETAASGTDLAGSIQLKFDWSVTNACSDTVFTGQDRLRLPFRLAGQSLVLTLPDPPAEREPDEL